MICCIFYRFAPIILNKKNLPFPDNKKASAIKILNLLTAPWIVMVQGIFFEKYYVSK